MHGLKLRLTNHYESNEYNSEVKVFNENEQHFQLLNVFNTKPATTKGII